MTPEKRTQQLRALMAQHKLKAKDVGKILSRSPQTVRSWACAYEHRSIPDDTLGRLKTALRQRAKKKRDAGTTE